MDIKEEDILGNAITSHWYYVSKGRALLQYLNGLDTNEVLDVGAGSGCFSRQLLDDGVCNSAVCVDPNYAQERKESHHGKPVAFVRNVSSPTQKLILMMDVLEHVKDDVALLKAYADRMPDDGRVLITVPAFQSLWSGHDVFLEHHRRYNTAMLKKTVANAGLEIVKINYFFATLLPLVGVMRLIKNMLRKSGALEAKSELNTAPPWLNALLIMVHGVERRFIFPINRIAGLSIFCLCKKPHVGA